MPFVMAIVTALGIGAKLIIGSMIAKIFLTLGVGIATYIGIDILIANITGDVRAALSVIPDPYRSFLALAQVDRAFNLILSAISVRTTLNAVRLVSRVAA